MGPPDYQTKGAPKMSQLTQINAVTSNADPDTVITLIDPIAIEIAHNGWSITVNHTVTADGRAINTSLVASLNGTTIAQLRGLIPFDTWRGLSADTGTYQFDLDRYGFTLRDRETGDLIIDYDTKFNQPKHAIQEANA